MDRLTANVRQQIETTTNCSWLHNTCISWVRQIHDWQQLIKNQKAECTTIKREIIHKTQKYQRIIDQQIEYNNQLTLALNECFNLQIKTMDNANSVHDVLTASTVIVNSLDTINKQNTEWLDKCYKFEETYSNLMNTIKQSTFSDIKSCDEKNEQQHNYQYESIAMKPLEYSNVEELRNLLIEKIELAKHLDVTSTNLSKSLTYLKQLQKDRRNKFEQVSNILKQQCDYVEQQCGMEHMKLKSTINQMDNIRMLICNMNVKDATTVDKVRKEVISIISKMEDKEILMDQYQRHVSNCRDKIIKFKPIDPM